MKLRYVVTLHNRLASVALCLLVCLGLSAPALAAPTRNKSAPNAASPDSTSSISTMPRVGLEALTLNDTGASLAGKTGVGVLRMDVDWSAIEPAPNSYNWGETDALFLRIAKNNMSSLATIKNCPAWACPYFTGPINEANYSDFTNFMTAAVARYSGPPYNVHYWELFNEPDGAGGVGMQQGWGLHPQEYVRMLSSIYPAVKAIDPKALIILGGLAYDFWFDQGGPFAPTFLDGVLAAGGANYLDAVAFHYYKANAHGWTTIAAKAKVIRDDMRRNGADLPLLCTETGWTSEPKFNSSEETQARDVVQTNTYAAASGLIATIWYLNQDYTDNEPTQELFLGFGLTRLDNSPKRSYYAMRTFASEIGSGAYTGPLTADDGLNSNLEGYKFQMQSGGRPIWVVWSKNNSTQTLRIPAAKAPNLVRVVGITGDEINTQPDRSGDVPVAIGADPVYLEWTHFTDVPYNAWSYSYVEYLASRGVIGGYADGTFRPNVTTTRQQFSKMAVLASGLAVFSPANPHFADVPADSPFYQFVETAYANGLLGGYACGGPGEDCPGAYFRPGADVTRGQIAKIIVLSKHWPIVAPRTETFNDVPMGSTFFDYIETSVAHRIVSGFGDGSFRPGDSATRAQLSKMLALSMQQP